MPPVICVAKSRFWLKNLTTWGWPKRRHWRYTLFGSINDKMELFKHSLDILPPDWVTFLDPSSFLELQCAHTSSFSDAQCIESFWCNLCRSELQGFLDKESKVELHLDTKSVKYSSRRGLSELGAEKELTKHERQRLWSKAYREMTCDVRQTCQYHSASESREPKFRVSGSLWMTAGNELRHDVLDFKFPALLDAPSWNEDQIVFLLNEVAIEKDRFNRHTSCHLRAALGGDRCVMASRPLPRLGVATVFPGLAASAWQVAWRPCSYYEVEIKATKAGKAAKSATRSRDSSAIPRRAVSGGRNECVSVGLALATIPWRGISNQQAGWNHSSWALHGDDGQLYHSHGQGTPFRALKNFVLKGADEAEKEADDGKVLIDLTTEESKDGPSDKLRRSLPQFGEGDVVGCGVAKFQNSFGIFFTLNGHFLGVAFQCRSQHEPRLWPCVGIDATWELAFNFGSKPFAFDTTQVIQELPSRNPHDNLSSLLMQYPSARWPGEAFESESGESESDGTFVTSRWSDASDSENSSEYILE